MKRKKPNSRSAASEDSPPPSKSTADNSSPTAGSAAVDTSLPSAGVRTWVSIWLVFHTAAIAVSFTSVVEPSSVHARLSELVHPYLRPAHFGADDRPVYLTYGDPLEQPHRLQTTTSAGSIDSLDDQSWQTATPLGERDATGGLAASDRLARWLSTIAMLAQNEQPSLVAELLLPVAQRDPSVTGIRVMRLPTDLVDINQQPEAVYLARVVRAGELISLVQIRQRRLSSSVVTTKESSNE